MTRHPYGSTSGWSGSDTSRARAEYEDAAGISGRRRQEVLSALRTAGTRGMTWKEVSSTMGLHHGQASGALSGLHKLGAIARLKESRDRCKVYVAPEFVEGRTIEPFGRIKPVKPEDDTHAQIVAWLDSETRNPEQNAVYRSWAGLFRNKITDYRYLTDLRYPQETE